MNAPAPASIPRIVHQTWRTKILPAAFASFRASWAVHHPAWEHRLYDDDECRAFVDAAGAPWPDVYACLPTAIQRADLFRYLVVHRHGGAYADVDMECYRPLDALLAGADCVLAIEAHLTERRRRTLGYREPRQLANCIFAAAPGNGFLDHLLRRVERLGPSAVMTDADVEDSTGPRMLTRAFEDLPPADRASIRVLPQAWLVPPDLPRAIERWVAPYTRHHFAGSWKRDAAPRRSLWRRWADRDRVPPLWPTRPIAIQSRGEAR